MGFWGGDPSIRLVGSQYECVCDLRVPGQRKRCGEKLRGDNEKDVKRMWKEHKKKHERDQKDKVNRLRSQGYAQRLAELTEEYGDLDNIPKGKMSGLTTKGIPNVPDGQKVTGLVYDNQGRRVPYELLKKHVQGWDD